MACQLAAGFEHPPIEGCIMGCQIVGIRQENREFLPDLSECWLVPDIVPADAVEVGEDEAASGRPDEAVTDLASSPIYDSCQAYGARAIGMLIGCLEVNRNDFHQVSPPHRTDRIHGSEASTNECCPPTLWKSMTAVATPLQAEGFL